MLHKRHAMACIAALLLAGCSGPAGEEGPAATDDVVATPTGDKVRADLGALRGRVHDDVNYSLPGARISILGTDLFAKAGDGGRFVILNVTPGRHDVQVLLRDFHPHRTQVTIEAGATTEADLLLLPLQARSGGFQPHLHDFWNGQDTYTLMDAPFDPAEPGPRANAAWPVYATVLGPTANNTLYRIPLPQWQPGHPSIVLPGTKEIRITLDWDAPTQTLPDLGVSYDTPEDKMYIPGFRAKHLPGRPPGHEFTIPVPPKWQDNGHALWTDWRFFVHMDNAPMQEGTEYRPGLMVGEIHVTIELVRGEVVLDPPHVDWWQDNTTISFTIQQRRGIGIGTTAMRVAPPTHSIVPPATARMAFTVSWDHQNVPDSLQGFDVRVLTADQDPDATPFEDMRRFEAVEATDTSTTYEGDLEPAWADPHYVTSSGWAWYLSLSGHPDHKLWTWPDFIDVTLEVTLWKET